MAKNKIEIDVKVDDKGTTRKVALGAKQAAEGLDKTGKSARTADRNLKGAAQASANGTKNFSKMAQGMTGGLVPAYAAFAAQVFALSAAFNFLKDAADLENLRKSQVSFAQSSGLAVRSVTKELQEASKGMLGFQEAAQAAAIGVAKGFSTAQLVQLTEGAGKASVALGRSYQDTFDRLLRGVSKAEPELLDELGITLRLESATSRYADAINKTKDNLTSAERSQAVFVETMRQLNSTFGDIEADANPFIQLSKTFEKIQQDITKKVMPPIIALVDIINNNATAAFTAFAGLAALILVNIAGVGPAIKSMFTGIVGSFTGLIGAVGKTAGSIGKVAGSKISVIAGNTLQDIDQAEQALQKKIQEAGRSVGKSAESMVSAGAESKVLKQLAEGSIPAQRELTRLSTNLEKVKQKLKETGEITSGAFKGATLQSIKDMQRSIKEIGNASLTTGEKIRKNLAKGGVQALKGMRLAARATAKAVSGIGVAASKAKGLINGMFSAFRKGTIILAVVFTVIKALDELAKTPIKVIDGFKRFLTTTAEMLQRVLNFLLSGINKLLDNSVVRKILGTKEGEQVISSFTFADNISENLDLLEARILNFAGTSREQLQEIDDATANKRAAEEALEAQKAKVDSLKESYKELGVEIADIAIGIRKQADEMKKTSQITTGIASMPIAAAIEKAGDDPELKKALDSLISSLDLSAFGEDFKLAVENKDVLGLQKLQTAALSYNTSLSSIKDASAGLRKEIGTGDPLKARALLQTLIEVANNGNASAEVLERKGGLLDLLNDAVGTDANSLLNQLKNISEELSSLEGKKTLLQFKRLEDSSLPQTVKQQRELSYVAEEANILLSQKKALLNQYIIANTDLTGSELLAHQQEVINREREIYLLEKKSKVAQDNLNDISQIGQVATNSFESGMISAFDSIIQGTSSIKEAFFSMAKGVLQALSQIIAKLIAVKLLEMAIGFFTPSPGVSSTGQAGGLFGTVDPFGGNAMDMTFNRYGGVVANGKQMPGYAVGGVARGPDAGYPAMLHGTEAVVPLPNGKSIPVDMKGSAQNNNVVVNVSVDSQGRGQTSTESQSGADAGQLGSAIARAVQQELQNQKRSGGILNPYGVA